jgi:hypothetical protein
VSIVFTRGELGGGAKVKTHPRIGEGWRVKDYGYEGEECTIYGIATDAAADLPVLREYATRRVQQVFRVPWGSAVTTREVVRVRRVRITPLGAAHVEFVLECVLVQ